MVILELWKLEVLIDQSDYILTELGNVSSQSRTTSFHDKFELCKEINKEALHINNIESQLNKNANNNCITKSATITDAAEQCKRNFDTTGKRLRRDTSVSSTESTKYDMSSNNDTLSMDSTNKSQSYK